MSLKNKLFSALTFAFAVFAFSTFAMAQETPKTDSDNTQKREWRKGGNRDGFGGKGFRRGGRGGGFMGELRGIELTDAQKQQIKTILDANRPDQAAMEEFRTLHDAKRNGTLTAEQQERLKTLKQQSMEKGQALHQQILAVLTPEQLQQVEKNKAEMKQRREERKQMRLQKQQVPQEEKKDN
jgi:Spy/CpxP family protein refolding chaperone